MRSIFGAVFPLFTTYMYENLGIHWATCVPAFLAVACVPFPFLFYKYGPAIRERCKYAAQSAEFVRRMQQAAANQNASDDSAGEKGVDSGRQEDEQTVRGDQHSDASSHTKGSDEDDEEDPASLEETARRVRSRAETVASRHSRHSVMYEGNPYDIDRVNTRQSFN